MVAFIPEVWTGHIENAFFNRTVAADFFLDISDMAAGAGDIFHFADIFTDNFISSAKSNAAEVTLVSLASGDVTMTINTWREVSYLIEDMELAHMGAAQVPSILDAYAEQAGGVLAQDLEDSLLALWSGLPQTAGATGAAVTDLQIRQTIRQVDSSPAPREDRAWFIHPRVFWDQIIGLQKFYDASQVGWGLKGVTAVGNLGGQTGKEKGLYGVLYGKLKIGIAVVKSLLNNKKLLAYTGVL